MPTTITHADLEPDSPLREYRVEERRSWVVYAALASSASLLATSGFLGPMWWRMLSFATGALVATGALARLWHRFESGCRVDREERVIVWWSGPQPASERRIAVDAVRRVRIVSSTGTERLVLEDADGEPIALPSECLPPDARRWAEALVRAFPHVTVAPEG